jgi:hypothetical protein
VDDERRAHQGAYQHRGDRDQPAAGLGSVAAGEAAVGGYADDGQR